MMFNYIFILKWNIFFARKKLFTHANAIIYYNNSMFIYFVAKFYQYYFILFKSIEKLNISLSINLLLTSP